MASVTLQISHLLEDYGSPGKPPQRPGTAMSLSYLSSLQVSSSSSTEFEHTLNRVNKILVIVENVIGRKQIYSCRQLTMYELLI